MRSSTVLTGLGILLAASFAQADDLSLGKRLEKISPRAAGIAQVEVVDVKEVDTRPSDGDLYLDVRLRIIQSTGRIRERIHITKARGGLAAPNAPKFKPPSGPVGIDTFKKGERYWIAFSSQYDWKRCPQGVVNSWPEKDCPRLLMEAIRNDHYGHRPQFHPESGLTHGYRAAKDGKSWRVRMEKDGKLLWEVSLPGKKYRGGGYDGEWRMGGASQAAGWFLHAETANRLKTPNRYGLAAGMHRLTYVLDADDGKTHSSRVSRFDVSPTSTPSVVLSFDAKTGKVTTEERYESLEVGGLAAGANEERWLRKLVRTYDATAKLTSEEVFRWTPGGKYIPVRKP